MGWRDDHQLVSQLPLVQIGRCCSQYLANAQVLSTTKTPKRREKFFHKSIHSAETSQVPHSYSSDNHRRFCCPVFVANGTSASPVLNTARHEGMSNPNQLTKVERLLPVQKAGNTDQLKKT